MHQEARVAALGAAGGVPGSLGVVEGDGQIPYTPEAAAIKKENPEHWIDHDPELARFPPKAPASMETSTVWANSPCRTCRNEASERCLDPTSSGFCQRVDVTKPHGSKENKYVAIR